MRQLRSVLRSKPKPVGDGLGAGELCKLRVNSDLSMGPQKPGFLRQYFVITGRFGKNPVSLVRVRPKLIKLPHKQKQVHAYKQACQIAFQSPGEK